MYKIMAFELASSELEVKLAIRKLSGAIRCSVARHLDLQLTAENWDLPPAHGEDYMDFLHCTFMNSFVSNSMQ